MRVPLIKVKIDEEPSVQIKVSIPLFLHLHNLSNLSL